MGVHAHQKEDRQDHVGEEELESSGPAQEVVAIVVVVLCRGRRRRGEKRGDLHVGRWRPAAGVKWMRLCRLVSGVAPLALAGRLFDWVWEWGRGR